MKRILLLGGVTEALAIARTLGPEHIYSLAGIGRVPTDLTCQVRVGGYGGAEGLAAFIRTEGITLLIDATHPYAAQISHNAANAARMAGIECWALRRPEWEPQPGDDWREVADWAELMQALAPFKRPLFTLGREPLQHLHEIPEHQFWTLRALDSVPGNERCEVIGARGPFRLEDERKLFARRRWRRPATVRAAAGSAGRPGRAAGPRSTGTPRWGPTASCRRRSGQLPSWPHS